MSLLASTLNSLKTTGYDIGKLYALLKPVLQNFFLVLSKECYLQDVRLSHLNAGTLCRLFFALIQPISGNMFSSELQVKSCG